MHERVNKSSSWTPTSIQKKSKSLHAKPSTSIQPKPENISSQQQEIPTYSTAAADLLAANIMRSLEPQEPESSETSTGKPQSELGQAAFPSIAAQIPSTPVVQSQEIGIQRQCSECAKEQSTEEATEEGKDIDEISLAASGIQTKLTIGAPPNPYQQAANQMAEVMSKPILYAPMPQVQRFSPQESQIQLRAASAQSISPMMQMSVEQQAQMSALIQRTFRGEETQASFEPVQAKLTVGEPGDKYEQEADAVARTVVEKINAPITKSSVQRQSEVGGASELNITVMRQRESGVGGGESVTQDVEQGIQQARGGGQGLDESVREPMEGAFGADFSGVRVHTDANSDLLNRSISARAFTTGQDIFFKQGEYNPGSLGGQELLAHELTHVVQQTQNQNSIQCNRLGGSSASGSASPDSEDSSRLTTLYRQEYVIAHSGSRYTLIPHQPNGRRLYFFYGYESGSTTDQAARDGEAPFIEDDVIYAARSGFTVVYDLEGTGGNFVEAIFNPATYGIYWSSHGDMEGNIWASDNFLIRPEHISANSHGRQISPNLRYFILAACGSARSAAAWQRVLPQGCQFEGWLNLTSDREGIDFTDSALSEELDQFFPHRGLHPDRELRDYIDDVRRESVVDISGN